MRALLIGGHSDGQVHDVHSDVMYYSCIYQTGHEQELWMGDGGVPRSATKGIEIYTKKVIHFNNGNLVFFTITPMTDKELIAHLMENYKKGQTP